MSTPGFDPGRLLSDEDLDAAEASRARRDPLDGGRRAYEGRILVRPAHGRAAAAEVEDLSAEIASPRPAPERDREAEASDRLLHHGIRPIAGPLPEGASTVIDRLPKWIWVALLEHIDRFRVSAEHGQVQITLPISYGKATEDAMIDATYCTRRPRQ